MAAIHSYARERASGPQDTQRILECFLDAKRFDGHVNTTAIRELANLANYVAFGLQLDRGAETLGNFQAVRVAIDRHDLGGAHEPGAQSGTQSDGALRKDRDRIAQAYTTAFSRGEAR